MGAMISDKNIKIYQNDKKSLKTRGKVRQLYKFFLESSNKALIKAAFVALILLGWSRWNRGIFCL